MTYLPTLQISTFGTNDNDFILMGIRSFPINKLVLICFDYDKQSAEDFGKKIRNVLGIEISVYPVQFKNVIRDVMEAFNAIINTNKQFPQLLVNVSSGEKLLGCAALSSAFINGIKTFGMDPFENTPILMPVLKLSYNEIISDAKLKILKSIENVGGVVESLEHLEQVSGYGKPLLSYHVQGGKDSKGLASLGLVEIEKKDRGKISTKVTALGKLLITSSAMTTTTTNTITTTEK